MKREIEYWRTAIDKWATRCPCTCDGCREFEKAISGAQFPQEYLSGQIYQPGESEVVQNEASRTSN